MELYQEIRINADRNRVYASLIDIGAIKPNLFPLTRIHNLRIVERSAPKGGLAAGKVK